MATIVKENKVCEVCGRELPISKFSKSYKNRCRECVAERTRLCRHLSKEDRELREKELLINQERQKIDWEERRFDLAKAAMVAIIQKEGSLWADSVAQQAVEIANRIVSKMKGGI